MYIDNNMRHFPDILIILLITFQHLEHYYEKTYNRRLHPILDHEIEEPNKGINEINE